MRPTVCEYCNKNKIQKNCSKGHSLCNECALECVLCCEDFFSVVDKNNESQVLGTINSKINGNAGGGSGEGIDKEIQTSIKSKRESFQRISSSEHYKTSPMSKIQASNREDMKGSRFCTKCALF